MTDKEIIEVVKAHSEGKQIQYCNHNDVCWEDCLHNNPIWHFGIYDYRVKPESKVRPYHSKVECFNEMLKHEPFGWVKTKGTDNYVNLTIISSTGDFEHLFRTFTYVDGSPFGIVEEE